MTATFIDIIRWEGGRDDEGHRTFECTSLVSTDSPFDGPSVVMYASGLPLVGSNWVLGNDNDTYTYCTPFMRIRMVQPEGEIGCLWHVDQKFTTNGMPRCNTLTIENPLAEPAKLSGGFISRKEEAIYDKDGYLILTSSLERMKGEELEIDVGSPTVRVTINVGTLPLTTFSEYRGGVNDSTLWGLPARCVKLVDISWERNIYGTCSYYYSITYEFHIQYETWNRFIPDRGTRRAYTVDDPLTTGTGLLTGKTWRTPMVPFTDLEGRPGTCFLNGEAVAVQPEWWLGVLSAEDDINHPDNIHIHELELEKEFNFMTLGIPASL